MALLSLRTVLAVLSLAVALAVLYRWLAPHPTIVSEEDITIDRDEPDLYGKQITFNQLRQDGTLHYSLKADTIRQYIDSEMTQMTQPVLHLLNPERPPWDVRSAHGYISKQPNPEGAPEDVVYLRDQVELIHQHPRNGVVRVSSATLYIYPERQYAQTDQNVMIDTEVGRTKAAGMAADMGSGLLKLSSSPTQRVHTIVLPEQFKKS